MNETVTNKEITLEQFLAEVENKPCCVESTDIDVISIDMRGCHIHSTHSGDLEFTNVLDTFEIEEAAINGIYRHDDGEFYIEFGDVFSVTVSIMSEDIYNKLLENLKQALSEVSNNK